MKRTVLLLAAVVALGGSAFAQNINKNEAKMLKTFLSQTSAKGTSNAVQLGAQVNNPAAIQGVKIQDGHVTEIEWKDKDHRRYFRNRSYSGKKDRGEDGSVRNAPSAGDQDFVFSRSYGSHVKRKADGCVGG